MRAHVPALQVYSKDRPDAKRGTLLAEQYEVPLPRRALQVQSGTVRYEYQHGIPNSHFLDDRRVSITFRQNIYNKYHC